MVTTTPPCSSANANSHWTSAMSYCYTGTADQPDVTSVFLKSRENSGKVKIRDEQCANALGHDPRKCPIALPRIAKAAEMMSKGFTADGEFWNGFKNFSRGVIQLVPLLGNGVLYLYDKLRTHFYTHPRLRAALSDRPDSTPSTIGIAFDGKPVFAISTSTAKHFFNLPENQDENSVLKTVYYLWVKLRAEALKADTTCTTRQLAEKLHRYLTGPALPFPSPSLETLNARVLKVP